MPQDAVVYLAATVETGDLRFADFPIEACKAAKSDYYDGLIGADVFDEFLVTIDFRKRRLELLPNLDGQPDTDQATDASDTLPAGFWHVLRFGHSLTVPTTINQGPPRLFVIDSGAGVNLIDSGAAQEFSKVISRHPPIQ
jgi:hypothetical protein